MPPRPMKPCCAPGCGRLTTARFCDAHAERYAQQAKQVRQQYDRGRGTAAERGYDSKWQKARAGFLRKHPLCVECDRCGSVTAATVVDHIVPHKGDRDMFWDRSNWQPLCKSCHDRKTAREDGGFGNARRT
ncbi:HNH endonuclease [Crenobacter cavernae]|uniref:Putative HNH nuclease YajD n=2 Tax=Crenobacter cavernae TaxID=2290923 RepID=A0ABY0FDZ1_9NEIS|nr:HNH endonuclease [Crenobacter cavernae]